MVPRTAIAVVRFSVQVLEARSRVARVRVTIGTDAFLVIVRAMGTIACQLRALISRLAWCELTRVGVQSVTVSLSIEVVASVTCSVLTSVAALLTVAASVVAATAVVASVTSVLLLVVVAAVAAMSVAVPTVALAALVVAAAVVTVGVAILSVGAALAAVLAVARSDVVVTVAVARRTFLGIAAIATIALTIVTILALFAVPILATSVGIAALVATIAIIG